MEKKFKKKIFKKKYCLEKYFFPPRTCHRCPPSTWTRWPASDLGNAPLRVPASHFLAFHGASRGPGPGFADAMVRGAAL